MVSSVEKIGYAYTLSSHADAWCIHFVHWVDSFSLPTNSLTLLEKNNEADVRTSLINIYIGSPVYVLLLCHCCWCGCYYYFVLCCWCCPPHLRFVIVSFSTVFFFYIFYVCSFHCLVPKMIFYWAVPFCCCCIPLAIDVCMLDNIYSETEFQTKKNQKKR